MSVERQAQGQFREIREQFRVYAPAILILLFGFVAALQFVKPAPPRQLVLAAGPPGGAYLPFAERYREILAREGFQLRVLETRGSLDNLRLLQRGEVDVAFLQGGVARDAGPVGLTSLGSLFFEPVWLFHRQQLGSIDRLGQLRGRRVAVGVEGSGTRLLADQLLAANGLAADQLQRFEIGAEQARQALQAGELDAAFFIAAPESELVLSLLRTESLTLASLARIAAYTRQFPFLSGIELPEGMFDLQRNIPDRDLRLLASAANLVARDELHPALVDLLLIAAAEIHRAGGMLAEPDQFPAERYLDLPLNPSAKRYYRFGPPLLQRILPFWAASLVDRLKVMLVPLVVLLIPLLKTMPPIYNWRMRSRIYRWYGELEAIEDAARKAPGDAGAQGLMLELQRLDDEVREISVPLSFAGQLYHLRQHIDLVRQRLGDR